MEAGLGDDLTLRNCYIFQKSVTFYRQNHYLRKSTGKSIVNVIMIDHRVKVFVAGIGSKCHFRKNEGLTLFTSLYNISTKCAYKHNLAQTNVHLIPKEFEK